MRILVDAFGGDHSPVEVIKGGLSAIKERQGFTVVFVGQEGVIEEELKKYDYDKSRVEILNASEVIGCDEEPTKAIMKKKDSSLCVAFKELKESADGFVSAGSTGAVLVGATLRTGRIKGVSRPALCPILPTIAGDKKVLLLDAGANADCKVINLVEFAIMGSVYSEVVLGTKNPKVALLSNGTEDSKGNALNHEVFGKLKELDCINFVGNIEARDILSGEIDVVVADGFSGKVALKSLEGGINAIIKMIKQKIYAIIDNI